MSNRRGGNRSGAYRTGYLRSPMWFARRDQWFREEQQHRGDLKCMACGQQATTRQLDLHHLDYEGVIKVDGSWRARERHEDLLPLHPHCHELLHRLIDRDPVLSRHRTRRDASNLALHQLQLKLHNGRNTADAR